MRSPAAGPSYVADFLPWLSAFYRCSVYLKWHESRHELTMCTHSPESQSCPGLHQEKRDQQVKGGDSAPLLSSGESLPGVLRPALEPPAQERHGPVGEGPEEDCKNGQMAGTPLLWEQAERVGAVQPGEEKASRDLTVAFQYIKEPYKKNGKRHFTRACSDRTRRNGFKLKEGRFRLDIKKNFSTMRVVRL